MAESLARDSSPAATARSLTEVMDDLRGDLAELERRLQNLGHGEIPAVREVLDHVLSLRGKRVRPLLVMLTARLGERWRAEDVLTSALVVELVHSASLIHDDCVDASEVRRGFPTVNRRWGSRTAILIGDYLFTKGFELLRERNLTPVFEILSEQTHRMTRGMNRELAERGNASLSADDYFRIICDKTGALFAASCEIGGVLGHLPQETVRLLGAFGRDLGAAFQIIDDIFDFTGDPAALGKPVGADFRLGFATLPLIRALASGPRERATRIAEIFRRESVTVEEWDDVVDFVQDSGGIAAARERALVLAGSARETLASLNGLDGVVALEAACDYVVLRGR